MNQPLQACPKCNRSLPIPDFLTERGTPSLDKSERGRWCRECRNIYRRNQYDLHGGAPLAKLRERFTTTRYAALKRGLKFEITFQQFLEVLNSRCAYGSGKWPNLRIGLDRKDNRRGYEIGNIVACCARHNEIKNAVFTHDEMLFIANNVASAKACGNSKMGRKKLPRAILEKSTPNTTPAPVPRYEREQPPMPKRTHKELIAYIRRELAA